jgi:hypothetical protein
VESLEVQLYSFLSWALRECDRSAGRSGRFVLVQETRYLCGTKLCEVQSQSGRNEKRNGVDSVGDRPAVAHSVCRQQQMRIVLTKEGRLNCGSAVTMQPDNTVKSIRLQPTKFVRGLKCLQVFVT